MWSYMKFEPVVQETLLKVKFTDNGHTTDKDQSQ